MGERRALIIGSQCEAAPRLSFLPQAAEELAATLYDPQVGGCVPALPGEPDPLLDPTMVELDDAIVTAFERASEDEATLFLAFVGHGEYAEDNFYYQVRDSRIPADSVRSFLLAQRIKELLGRYSMIDGLVILLDTCHAGIAAAEAARQWTNIVGQAGKRFEVLTASDHRPAADGCFTRSLAKVLREGRPELGEYVHSLDLKRVISPLCPRQTSVHLAFDGLRTAEKGDRGLWLAVNNADNWRRSPLAGSATAAMIEQLSQDLLDTEVLRSALGHVLSGTRCVQLASGSGAGVIAALANPSLARNLVPPDFLHAALFTTPGQTNEEIARELARQLTITLPGFADKQPGTDPAQSALARYVLEPLHKVHSAKHVHIAISVEPDMGAWSGVPAWISELTSDTALTRLAVVLGVDGALDIPGSVVLGGWFDDDDPLDYIDQEVSDYDSDYETEPEEDPFDPVPQPEDDQVEEPADGQDGDWRSQPRGPDGRFTPHLSPDEPDPDAFDALAAVLVIGAQRTRLPLKVARSALVELGIPMPVPALRELLGRMDAGIVRFAPGTPAEAVLLTEILPFRNWAIASVHQAIGRALNTEAPLTKNGDDTPEQVYAAANEYWHLWESGQHKEAVLSLKNRPQGVPRENQAEWEKLARRADRELGVDHPVTVDCWLHHATWTGKSGDHERAAELLRELEPRVLRAFGRGEKWISHRNNAYCQAMELGETEWSRDAFAQLVADSSETLGGNHRETIHARHLHAVATGKCVHGGPEALRLAIALYPEAAAVLDTTDSVFLSITQNIEFWSGELGTPPPNFSENRRRLDEARGQLNDHDSVLDRFLSARRDSSPGEVWTQLLTDALAVLGEHHQYTAKIRAEMARRGFAE